MTVHVLKTWPVPFAAVNSGLKTYEIRRADRPYAQGDYLVLREFVPPESPDDPGEFTGGFSAWRVTHMTAGGAWGLPPGLVVMGIRSQPLGEVEPGSRLHRTLVNVMTPEQRRLVWGEDGQPCPGCPSCEPPGVLYLPPPQQEKPGRGPDGRPPMPPSRQRFN